LTPIEGQFRKQQDADDAEEAETTGSIIYRPDPLHPQYPRLLFIELTFPR
jgi:hypothetical protein